MAPRGARARRWVLRGPAREQGRRVANRASPPAAPLLLKGAGRELSRPPAPTREASTLSLWLARSSRSLYWEKWRQNTGGRDKASGKARTTLIP